MVKYVTKWMDIVTPVLLGIRDLIVMRNVGTGPTELIAPNNVEAAFMVLIVITQVASVIRAVTPGGTKKQTATSFVTTELLEKIVYISVMDTASTMNHATEEMERVSSVHWDGAVNSVTQPPKAYLRRKIIT